MLPIKGRFDVAVMCFTFSSSSIKSLQTSLQNGVRGEGFIQVATTDPTTEIPMGMCYSVNECVLFISLSVTYALLINKKWPCTFCSLLFNKKYGGMIKN